ncbi:MULTISPECIES: ESX secretion-associated protein EspG [Actinoalloteichus]|uniref:EspG family n=1 Tax=Actinoalloteichus fjordicus TaxID=1612552 RepID=A0AAC9LHU6_9PSEU|nr:MULTISPECIES: ESX secretion-associated protein EspG [Actinoalloteichus]APU17847.1 EspG family [Actinoalloteichus fjordicus]APU23925.1 EspG family [Actinoalloteichus sp. GBA129-24]
MIGPSYELGGPALPIVLERSELNLLWRHLELGTRPLTLATRECGVTLAEAAEFDRRSAATLRERGLLDGPAVHPELAAALHCLAAPRHAVDLRWTVEPGREIRAMAAEDGRRGARGVLDEERLFVDDVHPTDVIPSVIAVLAEMRAGTGQMVRLPAPVVEAAGADGPPSDARFETALVEHGIPAGEAKEVLGMLGTARLRGGQLGVTSRDRLGVPHRAPWVIDVYDTVQGRYAVHHRDDWITVAPADSARLAEMLRELLEAGTEEA